MSDTVSGSTVEARARRHFQREGLRLRKFRTSRARRQGPLYAAVDSRNFALDTFRDVEDLARRTGVLLPGESVD